MDWNCVLCFIGEREVDIVDNGEIGYDWLVGRSMGVF